MKTLRRDPRPARLHPRADSLTGGRGDRSAQPDSAGVDQAEGIDQVMNRFFVIFFLANVVIFLGGCTSFNVTSDITPTQTLLATKTTSSFTRTPPSTRTPLPTSTQIPSPTATQIPILPPAGLLFQGKTGNTLWITQSDGTNLLLFEGPENSYSWPSYDLKKVTYVQNPPPGKYRGVPEGQYLVELATGKTEKIWPIANKNLCIFSFAGDGSSSMINNLMHPDYDLGYDCTPGSPVIAVLKGVKIRNLEILDDNLSSWGWPSISPDGKSLAFDIDGKPYLYGINGATYPFQAEKYGFSFFPEPKFYGPIWSPSGRYIAWDVASEADKNYQGVAIFDLEQGTSGYSPDHRILLWENWYGQVFWSADENYLTIIHPETDYFALIDRNGETILKFDEMENLDYFEWAPIEHYYAISRYVNKEPIITIESPDSSDVIIVGPGRITTWSPNGDALIFKRDDQYWLYDMQIKTSNPIVLPEGVHIYEWHDMNPTTTP